MKLSQLLSVPCLGLALVSSVACFAQDQEATATATATAVSVPAANVAKVGQLTVSVDLLGGTKIVGTLTDVAQLPIKTAFGEANVPMSEVAGVKLASADDPSTTVIMKNGDSITGATDLKLVTVDTEWGTAKINGSNITSLLLLPDLKWNATMGLNGKRWSLVDSKAVPAPLGPATTPASPRTQPTKQ